MANVDLTDIHSNVLDLLRMFLSASSRGDQAVLILDTRKGSLSTKYKCVEILD